MGVVCLQEIELEQTIDASIVMEQQYMLNYLVFFKFHNNQVIKICYRPFGHGTIAVSHSSPILQRAFFFYNNSNRAFLDDGAISAT